MKKVSLFFCTGALCIWLTTAILADALQNLAEGLKSIATTNDNVSLQTLIDQVIKAIKNQDSYSESLRNSLENMKSVPNLNINTMYPFKGSSEHLFSLLYAAIASNDLATVELVLKQNPNLGTILDSGGTASSALYEAIARDNKKIIELLLKQKPNLENVYSNKNGTTSSALSVAISQGKKDIVELLLKQKPNLEKTYTNKNGTTRSALYEAIKKNNKELIKLLLKQNPKPNLETVYTDKNGATYSALDRALYMAIREYFDDEGIKLILGHTNKKALKVIKPESLLKMKNRELANFIRWVNDGSQKSEIYATKDTDSDSYTDAQRFAPIALMIPACIEEFKTLLMFLGKDDTNIFTSEAIKDALAAENLEALLALYQWAASSNHKNYRDLIELMDKEILNVQETDFNSDFIKKLKTAFNKLKQSRAIIHKTENNPAGIVRAQHK